MMWKVWNTTLVPRLCARLPRSPSNCSVDPPYALNCKPARFSACPDTLTSGVPGASGSGGSVAQLLKMQLLHATIISFGNGHQITIDLNLFAGLRQMPQQMSHVAADCTH